MFKCCVCHKKASRRTSQEEDEDDSERKLDEDDDSTTEREDDDDEEEKVIEEELAKKFKCQIPNTREVNGTSEPIIETLNIENEEDKNVIGETVVAVINGDVKIPKDEIKEKIVDREALKEDVVEILNCAVKIVQEIRRGERERLEEIKEEAAEETAEEPIVTVADGIVIDKQIEENEIEDEIELESENPKSIKNLEDIDSTSEKEVDHCYIIDESGNEIKNLEKFKTDQIEEMIIEELINDMNEEIDNVQELKEIVEMANDGQQLLLKANNEQTVTELHPNESSACLVENVLPPPYCEVQIIDEIKKTEFYKIEEYAKDNTYTTDDEATKVILKQSDCFIGKAVEELIPNSINGNALDVPPFEESEEFEKSEENTTELSFPTPPPIDFDIEESEWKEDTSPPPDFHETENLVTLLSRRESKPTSPGSKSLPSPPSPPSPPSSASETGNETEADSKSSSDDHTAKIMPCGSNTAYIERSIVDVQDEDGDDSVFEATALVKDPEILKELPPRPGIFALLPLP
jgi:hypothetical protein